jgi:hypothetical protein
LDAKKFPIQNLGQQNAYTGPAQAEGDVPATPNKKTEVAPSAVNVKSAPDGAEIMDDEKYIGSTPSTLRLPAGDHKITLEKPGFKTWGKILSVSDGGTANVNVLLEAQ